MNKLVNVETNSPTTRDAFLGGKFEVLQPSQQGHRSGLDAILLAAALPGDARGLVADLGAGAGVAGLAAIALRRDLQVLLVENNHQMANLAFQSSKLSSNSAFAHRIEVLEADVTLSGKAREKAGLKSDKFDFVIMNPPYNDDLSNRTSDDHLRAQAHMMGEGGLDAWMRTATTIIQPRGMLAMIYRSHAIGQIIAAAQGRFGDLSIMPIYSHKDEPAKLLLVRAIKGSKAPVTFSPPLVVHNGNGSFTARASAILAGEAVLY
ncbi:MAG: methyltransferase [Rhizobiaceae bacterium]|nr:methyltransferase [Rhizobiaceae bacterium]